MLQAVKYGTEATLWYENGNIMPTLMEDMEVNANINCVCVCACTYTTDKGTYIFFLVDYMF
jgi:hypothetical protein